METTKTFQIKVTYLENGAVKLDQYDKEFTPFELLGIISHVKNEIEADLLCLRKPIQESPKPKYKSNKQISYNDFVECMKINVQSKHDSFTIGKAYQVEEAELCYRDKIRFQIRDNNGKRRSFMENTTFFKALS